MVRTRRTDGRRAMRRSRLQNEKRGDGLLIGRLSQQARRCYTMLVQRSYQFGFRVSIAYYDRDASNTTTATLILPSSFLESLYRYARRGPQVVKWYLGIPTHHHLSLSASPRLFLSTSYVSSIGFISVSLCVSLALSSFPSYRMTELVLAGHRLEGEKSGTLLSSERVNEQSRTKQSDRDTDGDGDHPKCNDQTLGVRVVVVRSLSHGHTTSCCHARLDLSALRYSPIRGGQLTGTRNKTPVTIEVKAVPPKTRE